MQLHSHASSLEDLQFPTKQLRNERVFTLLAQLLPGIDPNDLPRHIYCLSNEAAALKFEFVGYLRSRPRGAAEAAPEKMTIAPPYTPSASAHVLDEDDLLKAIPNHLGHGVSGCMRGEWLTRAMEQEGESDRAQARRLWAKMTDFWNNPGIASLEQLILQTRYCGEWKEGLFEIEQRQRGSFLLDLLHYGLLFTDLGLISSAYGANAERVESENRKRLRQLAAVLP